MKNPRINSFRILGPLALLLTNTFSFAQNQENFETSAVGSTSFTNAGQLFNVTSQTGIFDVYFLTGAGWNGSAVDNRFIDNSGSTSSSSGVQFTIASSSPFRMESVWLYLANISASVNVNGSLTIVGKFQGTTIFTANSSANFNNKSTAVNNGFTLVNFGSFGGTDNRAKSIDELVITTTTSFSYVALDAFRWTSVGAAPTVSTSAAATIGGTSAVLGGNVSAAGSAAVSERGIVWSTASNPTIANNKVPNGSGTGSFSATVGSLPSSTLIYYRAYATSTSGTSYGANVSFTTNAQLTIPSSSRTNVACFGACTGNATVEPEGGAGGYTYLWAPGGGVAATASNLCAGTYTCTVTDASGATVQRSVTITQPAAVVTPSPSSNSPVCPGGTIALTSSAVTGATYSWTGPNSFTSSLQNPSLTDAIPQNGGTYSLQISLNGCTGAAKTVSVTVITPSRSGGIAGTPGSMSEQTQSVGTSSGNYNDAGCNRISTIFASGANPVTGNITTKVWVDIGVPTFRGSHFVARHYEITPALNASLATGSVKLYFLQSEFNAFNATNAPLKLPANPTDAAGIANIRIGKYSGTSTDNSGLPGSYTGSSTIIDPTDNNIIWNAVESRWEISFDVNGFSGFILQSQLSILPLTLQSFTASATDGMVMLVWKTGSETNTQKFEVEKSFDRRSFSSIGSVQAAGNSIGVQSYSFPDGTSTRTAYYRLKMYDRDGSYTFSNVAEVKSTTTLSLSLYPNPAKDVLYLKNTADQSSEIVIYDITGRIAQTVKPRPTVDGRIRIDISGLTKGTYFLKSDNKLERFVKN
jgi:hypothetical protein